MSLIPSVSGLKISRQMLGVWRLLTIKLRLSSNSSRTNSPSNLITVSTANTSLRSKKSGKDNLLRKTDKFRLSRLSSKELNIWEGGFQMLWKEEMS